MATRSYRSRMQSLFYSVTEACEGILLTTVLEAGLVVHLVVQSEGKDQVGLVTRNRSRKLVRVTT